LHRMPHRRRASVLLGLATLAAGLLLLVGLAGVLVVSTSGHAGGASRPAGATGIDDALDFSVCLGELRRGDAITVERADGSRARFRVALRPRGGAPAGWRRLPARGPRAR
jgi:hypothetical protein